MKDKWRNSSQVLLPDKKTHPPDGTYDVYPVFRLYEGQIFEGFESLAAVLKNYKTIVIDGYIGVFYYRIRNEIDAYLSELGYNAIWINSFDYLKEEEAIDSMIAPFTGGDDKLFGKRATLGLEDFFDMTRFTNLSYDTKADVNIIIGPGASLAGWMGLLIYVDLPKNEIQYRARAGSITNLGADTAGDPGEMYRRFYFVDWIVLNRHKQRILPSADIIIDAQRPENPAWMYGDLFRRSISVMSRNFFRGRPWFEPGPWGGTWIRDHINGLNKDVSNYAWSFELISPENGLLFESRGKMLEVSFDSLMYLEAEAVLGDCHDRFGTNFPIRFDFLDTFNGGNLSVQCHPRPDYIKAHFGEDFTQEETYYIMDTKDNAVVFLGFRDNINPEEFRNELELSSQSSVPVEIGKYIQALPASKHDLFLIPYGTIHGSGKNNLVLEISTTPYIYTFKMYDWLRPDLDGNPRTLNIGRGMENLFFERKGASVKEELISKPVLTANGNDWQLYRLPTHETHLYDVHRIHFLTSVEIKTENKFHVLSLVEGISIVVEIENGLAQQFSYAETFIIPAAAGKYRLINKSGGVALVIKAFVK